MKKLLIILGITFAVSLVLVGVVYAFGTPQTPQVVQVTTPTSPAGVQPEGGSSDPAEGTAPAPDPGSPLAIEIPGCVCHSKDPKLVEEHAKYRMNQCYGCHKDGTPAMGQ